MTAKPFLDTNILVYAFAIDEPRTTISRTLLAAGGTISVQVLNEFVRVLHYKYGQSWPITEAALAEVQSLLDPPLSIDVEVHRAAVGLARDHKLHIYDALIIAAAQRAGYHLLLTEDMADGMRFGDLTIRNPFRDA